MIQFQKRKKDIYESNVFFIGYKYIMVNQHDINNNDLMVRNIGK